MSDDRRGLTPLRNTTAQKSDFPAELGQWYWVKSRMEWKGGKIEEVYDPESRRWIIRKVKKGETYEWLACVVHIGSNFLKLETVGGGTVRVHFRDYYSDLRLEPDADRIVREKAAYHQQEVNALLGEVRAVTERLGVVPTQQIADHTGGGNSLAVLSTQIDTTAYKKALVTAKDETLPELFKRIEEAHKSLALWMKAPALPLMASIGPMKGSIKQIEGRIYTISLYAGLAEDAVKCCDGDPAAAGAKLHVMQRRLYMDEECLLNYTAGGMEFRDIEAFDTWISEPENRDRILPFPRTLVAFQVRRKEKERDSYGNFATAFINIQLRDDDKRTFLYVRNGEQVWRVDCDFEFGEMIFPHSEGFNPDEPMMAKVFCDSVKELVSRREYEARLKKDTFYGYEPVDPSSVFFDDARGLQKEEIERYNRIATIIQGLFDRSLVLHPHPRVSMWTVDGFQRAVELIYDSQTLTYRDQPDFEAYRARLNASLARGSVTVGQDDFWARREAKKESDRRDRDWRDRSDYRPQYFRPYGNPGPGLLARIDEWMPRSRSAVFRWKKERRYRNVEGAPAKVVVPQTELLNVSAYQPGDYKQFYLDPRTRAGYLQWAPLLLAAEDYHAGKRRLGVSEEEF